MGTYWAALSLFDGGAPFRDRGGGGRTFHGFVGGVRDDPFHKAFHLNELQSKERCNNDCPQKGLTRVRKTTDK